MGRLALLLVLSVAQLAQQNPFGDLGAGKADKPGKATAVRYLAPEQITVAAGKATGVDLAFRVAPGLHINSHEPHEPELIATTLKLPETSGVRLVKADFPAGKDFSFPASPKEMLSVYTGEFTVHVQVVAAKGEHLVEGTLRYQACDNQVCMPPHTIPVVFDVIAQ